MESYRKEENSTEIIESSSTTNRQDDQQQNRHQKLEPPIDSNTFSELINSRIMGQGKSTITTSVTSNSSTGTVNSDDTLNSKQPRQQELNKSAVYSSTTMLNSSSSSSSSSSRTTTDSNNNSSQFAEPALPTWYQPQQLVPKRSCRPPMSRKFAHPCNCGQPNNHHKIWSSSSSNDNNNLLSQAALSSPLYLYDPVSKKCLPTSRNRDMLLRECQSHSNAASPNKSTSLSPTVSSSPSSSSHHNGNASATSCIFDDLVCDQRRFRCVCKPTLHLYYKSNQTTFGCIPIGPHSANCKPGYIYNKISKDCQKIFDVNDLPPSYPTGVSATQFSFVTIVLIWILLLILIVTAKLRKLRTSNVYRNSPSGDRRLNHHGNSYGHQGQTTSAWLHPFLAAVNGHHHLNQHRTTVDRHSQAIDESGGNYNDTDFFLNNQRTLAEILQDNNFTGSHQSLNSPPPKFEEIYPTPNCPNGRPTTGVQLQQPPSIEDLPSYDEAMKLRDTIPPDMKE